MDDLEGNRVDSIKVCSVIWPSATAFSGTVSPSAAVPSGAVLMRVLVSAPTFSQPPHHLMVLVAQHSRQEERCFVRAPGFEASPRPAFAVDGDVPLALGAGTPLAATALWQRLLSGVVA